MFFDEVALTLEGGRGGNGMVAFTREKFVSAGPPNGGDGGNGGSVIFEADENLNTFRTFSGKKHFIASTGVHGHNSDCAGRAGEDLILKVPLGTLVYNQESGELLTDLKKPGDRFTAARGGRGGYGNAHFVSSTRQAPKFAELDDIGEKVDLRLEMQMIADVGLVGFPSAGKSTLISHVSSAKPKIGDYPFTTLVPNLGVVYLSKYGGDETQNFVIADMPGLIEGASEGKGLGDAFLKHISRAATLVFLLDPFCYEGRDMLDQYRVLIQELKHYKPSLLEKDFLVAMNKIDAIPHEDREELSSAFLKIHPELKGKFRMISGVSGEGLGDFAFELWNTVQSERENSLLPVDVDRSDGLEPEEELYIPKVMVEDQSFKVTHLHEINLENFEKMINDQLMDTELRPLRELYNVEGRRIEQISRMTNLDQEEAIQRLYDVLQKMGIQSEIRRRGAKHGDILKIGPHFFEYHEL